MNIFIGGVHGVGKSFLASQLPDELNYFHVSASTLIKKELQQPNWNFDKKVGDAVGNQVLLATAVNRENSRGVRLLLDGHFVLKNICGEFVYLGVDVFSSLSLKAVILIEAEPLVVRKRIYERDGREEDFESLVKFIQAEQNQARQVCSALKIPLNIMKEPTISEFIETMGVLSE